MHRSLALIAACCAAVAAATPAAAQQAGHGHHHPAPTADSAKKDAHAGHGTGPMKHGAHATGGTMNAAEHMSGWRELDAYHGVMMAVWHPAKEKGDLAPARGNAAALATAADRWAGAPVPESCAAVATGETVGRVRADTRAFAEMVKRNAPDGELLPALRALHDRFEAINHGCKVR